jgi:hypothetical protein
LCIDEVSEVSSKGYGCVLAHKHSPIDDALNVPKFGTFNQLDSLKKLTFAHTPFYEPVSTLYRKVTELIEKIRFLKETEVLDLQLFLIRAALICY